MSTDRTNPIIEPFYFGAERPLFGCYHCPQRRPPRSCAVVLCYPMGEEYIRFHRAFRQLALQLTATGFPVLRFDFYGCGDSAGEPQEWRLAQWQADLSLAIAEARRRSGSPAVALIGLRLGATLAATVGAAAGDDIAAMVLWDAVLNGRAHLQELQSLHMSMLRRAHVLPRPPNMASSDPQKGGTEYPKLDSADSDNTGEILGFPLTAALRTEIETIDLLQLPVKPARQVLLVESNPKMRQTAFAEHLKRLGATLQQVAVASPQLWVWEEGVGKIVVPHSILQSITSWLTGVYPPQQRG